MRRAAFLFLLLIVATVAAAQTEPADAQGWFALGTKLHDAGEYRRAAEAFEKARAMGFAAKPIVNLRIARAQARAGDHEKAIALLEVLAKNGFGPATTINAEDDFLPLRGNARWKAVVDQMNRNSRACTLAPEFREFDYWLGEWDVEIAGQRLARSSIQLILDECVVFENYQDSRGYSGKSFSLWDKSTKKWEQRYVDTTGSLSAWTGGVENGRMVFYSKSAQGWQRMSYEKEGPDRVRQTIDASSDEGKTWTPSYNGLYIRRK